MVYQYNLEFDEEVEPIINVLTFKTLEESRMEVLEEEEIKGMKGQIQEFEKVRNRESCPLSYKNFLVIIE